MTHHLGICDWCRECKTFTSSAARDEWEMEHREKHTRAATDRWQEDTDAGAIGGKP